MSADKKILPEQLVLIGVLVLVTIGMLTKSFLSHKLADVVNRNAPQTVEPWNNQRYAGLLEGLKSSSQTPPLQHRLFGARLIAYAPETGKIDVLLPDVVDPEGIQIGWKQKYNFSIESKIGHLDQDNDGFTNYEEYVLKTSPVDPQDRGDLKYKIRVVNYEYIPFRMVFRSHNREPGGIYSFQINLVDVKTGDRSRLVKIGDMLEDYKIVDFKEDVKEIVNPATGGKKTVDNSTLVLEDMRIPGQKLVLPKGERIDSPESWVELALDVPDLDIEPSKVSRGKEFLIGDKAYKLVNPGSEEGESRLIDILDVDTGKRIVIPQKIPIGTNE
ncbi:MAG: Amuc_1099 family pilus-like system protein [Verrucomicrobiota bacterium]